MNIVCVKALIISKVVSFLTNILEWLLKSCEPSETSLDNSRGPLTHFSIAVRIPSDQRLNRFFDYGTHFVSHELGLEEEISTLPISENQQNSVKLMF
jgi:hypothetical protein